MVIPCSIPKEIPRNLHGVFNVVWLRGIPWKIFHGNSMEWFSWKVFHGIPWTAWSIKLGLLKCGIAIENISNRAKNFFRYISLCFNWTMNAKSLKNHWWLKKSSWLPPLLDAVFDIVIVYNCRSVLQCARKLIILLCLTQFSVATSFYAINNEV